MSNLPPNEKDESDGLPFPDPTDKIGHIYHAVQSMMLENIPPQEIVQRIAEEMGLEVRDLASDEYLQKLVSMFAKNQATDAPSGSGQRKRRPQSRSRYESIREKIKSALEDTITQKAESAASQSTTELKPVNSTCFVFGSNDNQNLVMNSNDDIRSETDVPTVSIIPRVAIDEDFAKMPPEESKIELEEAGQIEVHQEVTLPDEQEPLIQQETLIDQNEEQQEDQPNLSSLESESLIFIPQQTPVKEEVKEETPKVSKFTATKTEPKTASVGSSTRRRMVPRREPKSWISRLLLTSAIGFVIIGGMYLIKNKNS